MARLRRLVDKIIGREAGFEIKGSDLVLRIGDEYHVIRYLIGDEVNHSVSESNPSVIARYVETYSSILDKLPEGSEIKVVKKRVDPSRLITRISNEIMNLKATIDVVEEPHVKQKAMVKLKILEELYENLVKGRPITRLNLVVKIRGFGRDVERVREYLSSLTSIVKNMLYNELGIRVREASSGEVRELIRYELGLVDRISLKTIVVESEKIASILPMPRYKKPVMEGELGVPIGYDLETGWPVIIPLKTLNKHMIVLGPTGRGKTTFLASLVEGLVGLGDVRVLAIDFKGDLASLLSYGVVRVVTPREYLVNILSKPSFFNVIDWSLAVTDVLSNSLGVNRDVIVNVLARIYGGVRRRIDVEEILLDKEMSLLSPIIELLSSKPSYEEFEKIVDENILFNIGERGTAFQNTYGGILLHIYKQLVLRETSGLTSRVLIVDEAWRISGLRGLLELVKEGRSRGLGVVLATQNPGDIPREIVENTHTIIMFGSVNEDYRREARKILGLPQNVVNKLAYLNIGEAILLHTLDPHPVILKVRTPTKLLGSAGMT